MAASAGYHNSEPDKVDPSIDGTKILMPDDYIPSGKTRIKFKGSKSNVEASPIAIGAWPWGDTATWNYKPEERPEIEKLWDICFNAGVNFIDTAQAYGNGLSEEIVGDLVRKYPRDQVVVQTKYWVTPSLENILHPNTAPVSKLKDSLKRMKLDYVDIYLVHGPIHLQSKAKVAKAMAECVEQGLAKVIGVANYNEHEMVEMQEELAKYNIPLATNQCEFSVARRWPETSGLIKACRDRGIVFQSYSSLAQGRLSGKYHKGNEPPKSYRFSNYKMEHYDPILKTVEAIAQKRNTSISGVALNYNLSKGALPVVGMRNTEQAEANLKALGWRLTRDEIAEIDKVSFNGKSTVLWQHG
jgi:aryl-alcohol dehydrogenase-like predicted oxidoreductase